MLYPNTTFKDVGTLMNVLEDVKLGSSLVKYPSMKALDVHGKWYTK